MNSTSTHHFFRALLLGVLITCGAVAHAESWTVVPTGATADLNAITMLSDKVGYIAGENGVLLRTTNGGTTWTQQRIASGFNKSLFALSVIDTNSFGVVVGDQGADLQKDPASGSFTSYPQTLDTLYGVAQRIDSVVTFVSVGSNGFIGEDQWHTSTMTVYDQYGNPYDSSVFYLSSVVKPTHITTTLHAVQFNASIGYIVGDSGIVMRTADGGATWSVKSVGANVSFRSMAWIDVHKLLAVGLNGAMWMTTNDGTTWNNISPPGLTANLRGISFIDIHSGAIVGDNALIMQTSDGGTTWQRVGVNTFANLRGVYCLPSTVGFGWYAVGDGGTMVQTGYGGAPVTYTRDANELDFGGVNVGAKKIMYLNYTNTSATGYVTVSLTSPDPRVVLYPTQFIMEAQSTSKIKVTYTPVDTMPMNIVMLETDDASWLTDTVRVTGNGQAAMVKFTADTVVFDTAWAGRSRTLDAVNSGNLTMTATVVGVTDTNISVTCDPAERADKHITFTVTLKHTVKREVNAFAVVRTNDVSVQMDTIHIIAHAAPLAVNEAALPMTPATAVYPNPSQQGTNVTVQTADEQVPTIVRVYDALGRVVIEELTSANGGSIELVNTSALHAGRYFFEVVAPTGMRTFGGFVRN